MNRATGWTALLDQLHRDLSALGAAYRIEEFGTPLGGLAAGAAQGALRTRAL